MFLLLHKTAIQRNGVGEEYAHTAKASSTEPLHLPKGKWEKLSLWLCGGGVIVRKHVGVSIVGCS